jgi:methyl-accepting chemotaxis protein
MATSQVKRIGTFVSLRAKLLILFTLVFTVVFALLFRWFYTFASSIAEDRLNEALRSALVSTANKIDGDEFLALSKEGKLRDDGYTDDPRYWQISQWLYTVHEIDQRSWPYAYVTGPLPSQVFYIASSGAVDKPQWGVKFHEEEITTTDSLQQGLKGTATFLNHSYDWRGTQWVSGYTPIKNSKGEVVGGLGIDYNFDYVLNVRNDVRDRAVPVFAISYISLFLMVYAAANWFTRPVRKLTKVAERIGEGQYEQNLDDMTRGRIRDEIGILAEVFEIMVDKVYQREQTLKRQVEELKIEIDVAKRQKQVSEIVESDFFQELQVKASNMRNRRHQGPVPTEGTAIP